MQKLLDSLLKKGSIYTLNCSDNVPGTGMSGDMMHHGCAYIYNIANLVRMLKYTLEAREQWRRWSLRLLKEKSTIRIVIATVHSEWIRHQTLCKPYVRVEDTQIKRAALFMMFCAQNCNCGFATIILSHIFFTESLKKACHMQCLSHLGISSILTAASNWFLP